RPPRLPPGDALSFQREILDNGLQVVVTPSSAAPLVAIYLWLEAGSLDERPGEEGAAHFVEHMIFKGTERRGVGRPATESEWLDGDLNAWTTYEQTVLHAAVQPSACSEELDVFVDRTRNSRFAPEEFEREKLAILEEIRMYLADPDSRLGDVMV